MNLISKLTVSLLLPLSLIACSDNQGSGKVLATYKDGKITEGEVSAYFKQAFESQESLKDKKFSDLDSKVQESLVRNYILSKLMEKEAKSQGIEDSESFKEKLKAAKMQLIQQELIEKYVKNLVTDAEIENGYNQLVKNLVGKSEMQASHILVATEKEANDIEAKISAGANFADLAKQYSIDEGTKEKGGSLGKFLQGQFVPEFEAKLAKMKKGEISEPVKTKFGWHIIKLEDKRPITIPSKEDARQIVINNLNNDAVSKMVSDLNSKADIKILISTDEEKKEDPKEEDKDSSDKTSEEKVKENAEDIQ